MANNPQTEGDDANKKHFRKNNDDPLVLPKSAADKQRMQIEKLMRNPVDKPVYIPDKKREWTPRGPAEFVRDVMGSSAGAGSGEFHVYRGYRRRENARQAFINNKGEKEEADRTYHEKLEENQKLADQKTAKKRAKRLKQKQRMQAKKKKKEKEAKKKAREGDEGSEEESEESDSDSDKEPKEDDAEDNCFVIGGK